MAWQLQQAKQQFSRLVAEAMTNGPQVVTRNGREAVVVVSVAEYRQMTLPTPAEVLLGGVKDEGAADLLDAIVAERGGSHDRPRDVTL